MPLHGCLRSRRFASHHRRLRYCAQVASAYAPARLQTYLAWFDYRRAGLFFRRFLTRAALRSRLRVCTSASVCRWTLVRHAGSAPFSVHCFLPAFTAFYATVRTAIPHSRHSCTVCATFATRVTLFATVCSPHGSKRHATVPFWIAAVALRLTRRLYRSHHTCPTPATLPTGCENTSPPRLRGYGSLPGSVAAPGRFTARVRWVCSLHFVRFLHLFYRTWFGWLGGTFTTPPRPPRCHHVLKALHTHPHVACHLPPPRVAAPVALHFVPSALRRAPRFTTTHRSYWFFWVLARLTMRTAVRGTLPDDCLLSSSAFYTRARVLRAFV